ncbi:hypothetical protein D8Y20_11145 [Mariprofundus sp. EBB-1]|uniref:hypothetical protein n=1 Tax=Mariprofundus sp. EBB-1 TaxID=2650971 RepID=UPI000EF22213|nr:hypothetical protein [Mariprofundus sp. EBB-1]RLL50735.1 hypothetical protein D8Y20_11145 [Mariprofundus sp. EBB-1]
MNKTLHKQYAADPCAIEIPSPWSMDHYIWRVWTTLHFLPLSLMQSGKPRKKELNRIATLLHENNPDHLESCISLMLKTDLLKQRSGSIVPQHIHWPNWQKLVRTGLFKIIRGWNRWSEADEIQALQLLNALPINTWLKLDELIESLQEQASGAVIAADWLALFTQQHGLALHHLNLSRRSIFFLPEFQAVLNEKTISFPAPGWHGADENARISGFISNAGEIQLTPDCAHHLLPELSSFCNITHIEQMITLQLDKLAIERMATDKKALLDARTTLESIQSPLPQSIIYIFDKTNQQQAIASAASTSMVMILKDVAAIHRLQTLDFEYFQPFDDKPEIVLLNASADAHAFVRACHLAGIQLDTLIPPLQWTIGTPSLNAWMQVNVDREGQWLEIVYQKTLGSAPKQVFARIDADFYGAVRIQPTRKTKQRYQLQKTTVELQPKHILRLRELEDDEISQLRLDRLGSIQA